MKGHQYRYAVEQVLLTLFPQERPEFLSAPPEPEEDAAVCTLSVSGQFATAHTRLVYRGRSYGGTARVGSERLGGRLQTDRLLQQIIKRSFFKAAVQATGISPPWGSLTGIRPAKIVTRILEEGGTEGQADRILRDIYSVSDERRLLCMDAALAGLRAKRQLGEREISLYVGIPFCPTRCAYCSFVSHSVEKSLRLVEPFLSALLEEIDTASRAVREAGLSVSTIYVGGGTPTTLSPEQLRRLTGAIAEGFDLSRLREYTVEAGRPDTVTEEKLAVLRDAGVTRLSINPQSMEDAVLAAIGRNHSAADVLRAVKLARDAGDWAVNMDMIAGLPEDSAAGFRRSLDAVLSLNPENITIHTLALKKGTRLALEGGRLPAAEEVGRMLDLAARKLRAAGYAPYYLYRQKFMSGNFENVGWCRPGFEGLYNIYIMEELQTILALGAGGSTKLVYPETGRIERVFNPKYPYEYIGGIEKIKAAKAALFLPRPGRG